MDPGKFFSELKRRNVYKVAAAYAVVGWLLLQGASIILPTFEAPSWTMKVLIAALAIGFPVAVVLAWVFELTPQGLVRSDQIVRHESIPRRTGRKLDYLIIGVLMIVITLLITDRLRRSSLSNSAAGKSIAVLPFENLSRDPDNAYFADGIQDEILTRLAKIAALKVISRTSTQKYKSAPENLRQIGKELGVANLLEGSVQKIANSTHINVQLIRVATDEHLWAESYSRKLDDVFAVEGEVATAIADQLKATLTGAEEKAVKEKPTQNVAAYEAYLRGVAIEQTRFGYDAFVEAARNYAEAVQLDPSFALAWSRLTILRSFLFSNGIDAKTN